MKYIIRFFFFICISLKKRVFKYVTKEIVKKKSSIFNDKTNNMLELFGKFLNKHCPSKYIVYDLFPIWGILVVHGGNGSTYFPNYVLP